MYVRALLDSDIPKLKALENGFPYCDPKSSLVECFLVVADEKDEPVAACAAERILQLYLWVADVHPAAKIAAIRHLHSEMASELKEKGYQSVECFLPPSIYQRVSRRLIKTFGWQENWRSLCKHF